MIPSTAITSLLNSLNIKNTTTYNIGNLDPSLLQAQKCGMVKLVKWDPKPSLLINGSLNSTACINNKKKPAQIHFHSKRPHTVTQMNKNISLVPFGSKEML